MRIITIKFLIQLSLLEAIALNDTSKLAIIRETCKRFIANFNEHRTESLPDKLKHNSSWKESVEILAGVATNILDTL